MQAIRVRDVRTLAHVVSTHPHLAAARLPGFEGRTLLHVATEWPRHLPYVAATIRTLVGAGADVNARSEGRHRETPLHWAAGSDDPDALDALLWAACHGGHRQTAERLLLAGAHIDWVGYDGLTALAAAERSEARELAAWLRDRGATYSTGTGDRPG